MESSIVCASEAAKLLGVSHRTLLSMIDAGQLTIIGQRNPGRRTMIRLSRQAVLDAGAALKLAPAP